MMRFIFIAFFTVFNALIVTGQEYSELDDSLLIAAYDGDSAKVADLIKKGANVNVESLERTTPLMLAAQNGHNDILSVLIKNGAKINAGTSDGITSLILAISAGNIESAEFLIRNGANANLADEKGISPLMHAIQVDSFYIPDLLLYYGVDVNHKDDRDVDALMLACFNGRFEIAVRLLEAGADINSSDNDGNTPLHYATSSGNPLIMDLLIINGAYLDAKNNTGFTPLAVATSLNLYNEAVLLIGYGADVNARIRSSLNPLIIAINNRNDSLINLLKINGAELLNKPDFSLISGGTGFSFNQDDSRLSITFGLSDRRFYWMPSIIYSFRPGAIKILDTRDSSVNYQYWERRHFAGLDLTKAFFIRHFKWGLTTAGFAGIGGVFTFGSYRGSSDNPQTRFLVSPNVGILFEYEPFRLKFGYEFLDLHLNTYNNNRFTVAIQFLLNSKKRNLFP